MPASKSQQKAVHKYVKANYDRMELVIPKGQKGVIKAHAENNSESTNAFVWRAVQETMERDTAASGALQETAAGILPPSTLQAAQEAAEAAGEGLQQFIDRAVEETADRDALSRRKE